MEQFLSLTDKKALEKKNCKQYEKLKYTILRFDDCDVITASLIDNDNVDKFKPDWFDFWGGIEE